MVMRSVASRDRGEDHPRVADRHPVGNDDVVPHEEAIPAGLLGGRREIRNGGWVGVGTEVRDVDGELHGWTLAGGPPSSILAATALVPCAGLRSSTLDRRAPSVSEGKRAPPWQSSSPRSTPSSSRVPTPTTTWPTASTTRNESSTASAWRTICGSPSATGIRSTGRARRVRRRDVRSSMARRSMEPMDAAR